MIRSTKSDKPYASRGHVLRAMPSTISRDYVSQYHRPCPCQAMHTTITNRDRHYSNRRHDASVCETPHSRHSKVYRSGNPPNRFVHRGKFHALSAAWANALSAAWARRWWGLEIINVFVAHKRNLGSVHYWELLTGYWEMAEALIFGNRNDCYLSLTNLPRTGIYSVPSGAAING
jgi:hypothetical protein